MGLDANPRVHARPSCRSFNTFCNVANKRKKLFRIVPKSKRSGCNFNRPSLGSTPDFNYKLEKYPILHFFAGIFYDVGRGFPAGLLYLQESSPPDN